MSVLNLLSPLLLGSLIVVCLRFALVSVRSQRYANIYLVLLGLSFSIQLWNAYTQAYANENENTFVFGWPFVHLYWLIAPLLYLFLRSYLSTSENRPFDVLHAFPFLAFTLYSSFIAKVPFWLLLTAWTTLSLLYIVGCIKLLLHTYQKRNEVSAEAFSSEVIVSSSLILAILLFIVADIILGLCMLSSNTISPKIVFLFELSRSLVCLVLVFILQLAPHYDNSVPCVYDSHGDYEKKKSPSVSRLTESSARAIARTLEEKMSNELIFKEPDLNLSMLSTALSISPHELSEVLNLTLSTNFYNYINTKRVHYAANILNMQTNKPILDVAMECGFNSKSSFYTHFKKHYELSPAQYKKRKAQSRPLVSDGPGIYLDN